MWWKWIWIWNEFLFLFSPLGGPFFVIWFPDNLVFFSLTPFCKIIQSWGFFLSETQIPILILIIVLKMFKNQRCFIIIFSYHTQSFFKEFHIPNDTITIWFNYNTFIFAYVCPSNDIFWWIIDYFNRTHVVQSGLEMSFLKTNI